MEKVSFTQRCLGDVLENKLQNYLAIFRHAGNKVINVD
jgi:hypothetical protein